ncbi:hypothetical protein IsfPm1_gp31 [Proteus phage Isf-Pm1]|nr:hypothetical protein IsfPm1_gp31 [Proteus phage Isf-Pm1]
MASLLKGKSRENSKVYIACVDCDFCGCRLIYGNTINLMRGVWPEEQSCDRILIVRGLCDKKLRPPVKKFTSSEKNS